jgi:hypothetical protein
MNISSFESWRATSEERRLIRDVPHAEKGLTSQLPLMISFKGALDDKTTQTLGHNRRPERSEEDNEIRLHEDKLACFLRRHGNGPPRPYSRYISWSTRHGEVVFDPLQYARSLQELSRVSWIRLAFKNGVIGEEIDWCVDGQLWRLIGRGPTHSVDGTFADHGKYQRRYLIYSTVIVDYFLRHWIKGWAVESEKPADSTEDGGKTATFSPIMDLKEMEIMIQDIEYDLYRRIKRGAFMLYNEPLPVVAIIWRAWLDRIQKGRLSEVQYCVSAICSNLDCKGIEKRVSQRTFLLDRGETTIFETWQRTYPATRPAKNFVCGKCRGRAGTKSYSINSLPSCLAVIATTATGQGGIRWEAWKLPYLDTNRRRQIALFRWLGGIFLFQNKCRVYWRDASSPDALTFSMYICAAEVSSMNGLIISGLNEDNAQPIEGPYGNGQRMSFYGLEHYSEHNND